MRSALIALWLGLAASAFGQADKKSAGPDDKPQSIVFLFDRSGSMDEVGDFAKVALARTVYRLNPEQKFNVVFFSQGEPLAMRRWELMEATDANKRRLIAFLTDVSFKGTGEPVPAIKLAFELRAERIHLLGDDLEDKELTDILAMNAKKVPIDVTAFRTRKGEGLPAMAKLAEKAGGRFVDFKLPKEGEKPPTLGMTFRAIDDAAKKRLGVQIGVVVEGIDKGGRAEAAGIRIGDVLTKLNGNALSKGLADCQKVEDRLLLEVLIDPEPMLTAEGFRDGMPLRIEEKPEKK